MTLSGKRVVLAEDEAITVMYLRHVLRQAGIFVVGTATTGEEAVEVVLNAKPDLMIVDINLPTIDGLEALQRIQSQYPVCAIVLSAYSDKAHRARAKELGVCGYLVKPLDGPMLLQQLEAAYSSQNAPAEA